MVTVYVNDADISGKKLARIAREVSQIHGYEY